MWIQTDIIEDAPAEKEGAVSSPTAVTDIEFCDFAAFDRLLSDVPDSHLPFLDDEDSDFLRNCSIGDESTNNVDEGDETIVANGKSPIDKSNVPEIPDMACFDTGPSASSHDDESTRSYELRIGEQLLAPSSAIDPAAIQCYISRLRLASPEKYATATAEHMEKVVLEGMLNNLYPKPPTQVTRPSRPTERPIRNRKKQPRGPYKTKYRHSWTSTGRSGQESSMSQTIWANHEHMKRNPVSPFPERYLEVCDIDWNEATRKEIREELHAP